MEIGAGLGLLVDGSVSDSAPRLMELNNNDDEHEITRTGDTQFACA